MKKKSAEDYLDNLLSSVNNEKVKKEKFKETAKMLEDAMTFWDTDFENAEFEDIELEKAQYEQLVANENKKSEREGVLDALLSGAKDIEFGMNKKKPDTNPMYSRRVSKSEAAFLREFEEELADNDDDLDDLFAEFEEAVKPEDRLEKEDINAINKEESFTLGDVDLAALVNEAADVMSSKKESIPVDEPKLETRSLEAETDALEKKALLNDFAMATEPIPMDEIPDHMFEELFSGEGGLNPDDIPMEEGFTEDIPTEMPAEGLDLGNLGEEDLMNLLAGTDGLEDIGNMLRNDGITEISSEELDTFSSFAENEMAAQQMPEEPVVEEQEAGKKKGKKVDFFGKIKGFISALLKDDDDEVDLKSAQAPTVAVLTSENADILAELEALEEMPSKKDAKKKEKKKKEKKQKAPKKAKPKKPKAPKQPKPKKEKKPKEVDNTPPLPKGPVIMIWVMAVSMVALVLIGVDMIAYNTPFANAKELQNKGYYAEAFTELNGLTIKEKDMQMYNQLAILATVDSEINAYEVFTKAEVVDKAFDSLICAAGRCYINEEDADVHGCLGQLEILKKSVSNELQEKYNMTYEEAIKMYTIRHRDDYTLALYKKLTELGIEWD